MLRRREAEAEANAFMKATGYGTNKKKVRELGAEIRKRLEATPNTTVSFTETNDVPEGPVLAPSVSPSATAPPVPSPSPTKPKL
jgi:hypothetical protein